MILEIFTAIFGLSLTGSALLLLFLLLSPLLRRFFSAGWYRGALCVLLSFFALPAGLIARPLMEPFFTGQAVETLPFIGEAPMPLVRDIFPRTAAEAALPSGTPVNLPMLLAVLWLCVAAALLVYKILSLARFRRRLRQSLRPVRDAWMPGVHEEVLRELGIQKEIRLYQSPHADTPMLVGPGPTAVILPDIECSREELILVLRHELTHYRHGDLWVKWAGAVLCALHWFNPFVWLLTGRLGRWMELACDASVVRDMDLAERRAYGTTILSILGRGQQEPGQGVCAAFCEDKQSMKERLTAMLNAKKSTKIIGALSVFALAILCAAGMLIGGLTHSPETEALPNESTPDASPLSLQDDPPEENIDHVKAPAPLEEGAVEDEPIGFVWPVEGGKNNGSINSYRGHTGMDITAPQGTVIRAAQGGTVTYASNLVIWPYGRRVDIDHGGGYITRYAHCHSVEVSVGEYVEQGQSIATAGRTGNATLNHLHFEIRFNDDILDPQLFVGTAYADQWE